VTSPQTKTGAAYRPRRAALNWVDYLVIAITAAVFFGVLAVNQTNAAPARILSTTIIPASELPSQDARTDSQEGMIRARIGLALAGR
jgi:hypothetical protein